MAKNNAATDPNPCAKKETDDKDASKDVLEKTRQRDLAWKNLNTLKDTIDPAEWTAIRRQLNFGDWPEDVLGPFNNPVHNYTTLVNAAKAVYNAIQALKEAQDAANAARDALRDCKLTPEYRKWVNDQANRSACGAPCTSWGRKGQFCQHILTEKRCCPNHGQRPPVAAV